MQLTKRFPELEPDPGIVKTQVEAFKNKADIIIEKLASVAGLEEEDESQKGSTSIILSEVAAAILDVFRQRDESELWLKQDIISSLRFPKIAIESGRGELREADMLMISGKNRFEDDFSYKLLPEGRKYIIDNM
jgi:hypothetical protein